MPEQNVLVKSDKINSLDFFKTLLCIGIVFIHCQFPSPTGGIIRTISRIGVPFFFMISGYFSLYGKELSSSRSRIRSKIKHVLWIALCAGIFYFIFHIFAYCIVGGNSFLSELRSCITFDSIARFIIQDSPFVYSHLWFVLALIYCYLFHLIVGNRIRGKWKRVYILIALIMFTLLSEILPSFGIKISFGAFEINIHNIFLFRALPFYLIGIEMRENTSRIESLRISNTGLLVGIVFFEVVAVVERAFLTESQFYIGTYFAVVFLFIFCIRHKSSINRSVEFIGSSLSMFIYVIHIAIMDFLKFLAVTIGVEDNLIYNWLLPILVVFVSLFVAFLAFSIKNRFLKRKNLKSFFVK